MVPDILSSAGGVVVSYLEWAQNIQRERWPESRVNDRLQQLMETATDETLNRANSNAITPRVAAYEIAIDRVVQAGRDRGWY